MQEHSCHRHHRYIYAEENFARVKEIPILINRRVLHQSFNGHIDCPFEPKNISEGIVLEGKTQPYIKYNDIL